MRKIVQITATGVQNTMSTQCNVMFFALCDDGTVWFTDEQNAGRTWFPVAPIPQPAESEVTNVGY